MTIASDPGSPQLGERLLTPEEVGNLYRVDPKTVTRWAAAGKIDGIRTPGNRWRFRESAVRELLGAQPGRPS